MPDLTTLPLLANLLRPVVETVGTRRDDFPANVCLDYLDEKGATLDDVVAWYASGPPWWLRGDWYEDEAARAVLAAWCKRHDQPLALVDGGKALPLRFALAEQATLDFDRHDERWMRNAGISRETVLANLRRPSALRSDLADSCEKARRRQKRAVLALFPEVTRTATAFIRRVSDEEYAKLNGPPLKPEQGYALGIRVDMPHDMVETDDGWHFTQTLAAPDWIPARDGLLPGRHTAMMDAGPYDPLLAATNFPGNSYRWVDR